MNLLPYVHFPPTHGSQGLVGIPQLALLLGSVLPSGCMGRQDRGCYGASLDCRVGLCDFILPDSVGGPGSLFSAVRSDLNSHSHWVGICAWAHRV